MLNVDQLVMASALQADVRLLNGTGGGGIGMKGGMNQQDAILAMYYKKSRVGRGGAV